MIFLQIDKDKNSFFICISYFSFISFKSPLVLASEIASTLIGRSSRFCTSLSTSYLKGAYDMLHVLDRSVCCSVAHWLNLNIFATMKRDADGRLKESESDLCEHVSEGHEVEFRSYDVEAKVREEPDGLKKI